MAKTEEKPFDAPVGQALGLSPRKPYSKPELLVYGRIEDMTRASGKSGKEPRASARMRC